MQIRHRLASKLTAPAMVLALGLGAAACEGGDEEAEPESEEIVEDTTDNADEIGQGEEDMTIEGDEGVGDEGETTE